MTEMEEKIKIQDWVDEKFKDKLTGRNIQQLYLKSDLVDSIYEYSQVRFNEKEKLEKENGKLEGKLADLQSEYAELENFKNNEVKGLKDILEIVESENVRLIGKLTFIENTLNNRIAQLTITQLTKAKEIIEKLISQNRKLWVYSDVREEAEQFLEEVDK